MSGLIYCTSSRETLEEDLYNSLNQVMNESHATIFARHSIANGADRAIAMDLLVKSVLMPTMEKLLTNDDL